MRPILIAFICALPLLACQHERVGTRKVPMHQQGATAAESTPVDLLAAILRDETQQALNLLARGIDPNARAPARVKRVTPLSLAAQRNNLSVVRALLERGAEVDSADAEGWTPLMIAAKFGNLEIAKALLQQGASPQRREIKGMTPLLIAVVHNRPNILEELLRRGGSAGERIINGPYALNLAATRGNLKLVQLLLQHGADPNVKDPVTGFTTPLMTAAKLGNLGILNALVSGKANVNITDIRGRSALMVAAESGQLRSVDRLLALGAQTDLRDQNGLSALELAQRRGSTGVVQSLLVS